MAILYPTSLANLLVEVGTRHCHQTLLETVHCGRQHDVHLSLDNGKLQGHNYKLISIAAADVLVLNNQAIGSHKYWFNTFCTWPVKVLYSTQIYHVKLILENKKYHFNIKMSSCQYMNYTGKMTTWSSYLYNGNLYTWKDDLSIDTLQAAYQMVKPP